jgi:hypothetical protein
VLFAFIDYLNLYFATGDAVWKHLYVGEKLKLLRESGGCAASMETRREKLADDDRRGLLTIFRRKLPAGDFAEFERGLASVTSLLATRPEYSARVLLIGDFLQLDTLALLDAQLLEERIALDPTCIANTDAAELHAAIRDLAQSSEPGYDLVLYTPMSDLDCPAIAQLNGWRMSLVSSRVAAELAASAVAAAIATVELVRGLWTCPILVNNATAIARHDPNMGTWLRHQATHRARREFCEQVNRRLKEYVGTGGAVTLFDEHALQASHDEWVLGEPLAGLQRRYPILLGKYVAEGYQRLIGERVRAIGSRVTSAKGQAAGISVG